jgi:hypothetical protein
MCHLLGYFMIQITITTSKDAIFRSLSLSLAATNEYNQCAHTVDTYKLVSIPPEKKKEAQPRREKNMEKKIVTKKYCKKSASSRQQNKI